MGDLAPRETVLVTGGAGYVGSHTCKALATAGYLPVAYDNLCRGHAPSVKWGPLEIGDILDRERVREVLVRHRPSALLHFAAFAYVGESVERPELYRRNNVEGSAVLFDVAREHGIRTIVLSSSCATYGNPERTPIDETHPQRPVNPYGASKLETERLLRQLDRDHGVRSIALRYFNAAGADPAGEIGEVHDPETHLVPLVLEAALGRRESVTIFGDDYDTEDGTCVRDFVHVTDLADAHVKALAILAAGAPTDAMNLGTGHGASVRQIIESAERVTGKRVAVRVGPRRAGDPPILVARAARAASVLGWAPRRAALELQIEDAWRWMRRPSPST